jgi:ubiquitin carboxyl-terminal hydrolase L3
METSPFEWPPLESDPEIFNRYFKSIGLPVNISFEEVYSLDYKEIQVFPNPILGVIVAVRRNKDIEAKRDFIDWTSVPYFMRQTGTLDNACGLIAALHCIGNNRHLFQLEENSILDVFYNKAASLNHEERAKLLEDYDDFKRVHKKLANEGQSKIPQNDKQVTHHFVGFVHHEGRSIELDGTKGGPVVVKESTDSGLLLDDVVEEVKKRLGNKEISENLSIIVLTYEYS